MKYALITGASRGIGRAIAKQLAAEGHAVVINYLNSKEEAEILREEIEADGGIAELLQFDASNGESIEKALDNWELRHEGDWISVLVNNAGIRHDVMMFMMGDEDWHSVIDTTLNGFFYLTRRILRHMMPRHRGGRIINIASLSGMKGMAGQTNYSAAKAAIIGATRSLAQEVASRGVTVNAVAPGFIETDMTHDLNQEELTKMIPAGRFGRTDEVASLVAFLASDKAAYITGETININGGLL